MNAASSPPASARPRFDVGDLLRTFGGPFLASASLSPAVKKVLHLLMACRTAELGGHMASCHDCALQWPEYNSCGNRHCPKCQGPVRVKWVHERMASWLPVHAFHSVFTLPAELRPLVLANRTLLFNLLFHCVAETLRELADNPKWLGALPGFTLVLHTWARDLSFHPHIHAIITGGGLTQDELTWKATRPHFFIPVRVISALFRGKFLDGLKKLHEKGALSCPGMLAPLSRSGPFHTLLKRLHARDWVVYVKPPFSSAQQVLQYLGHYTHRFGLSNSRLQEVKDGCIRFKTRGAQSVTLRLEEFFRRFTLHILPERFMRIRHYGLLGSGNRKKLEKARALLNASGEGLSWSLEKAVLQQKEKEKEKEDRPRKEKTCPGCGGTHITRKPLEGLLEGWEPKRRGWEVLVEKLRRLAGGIEARTGPS